MLQGKWLRIALLSLLGAGGVAVASQAATIDTFDFTDSNLTGDHVDPTGTVLAEGPFPGATISGSFTGTVEPDGLIEQGDLTAFSAELTISGSSAASLPLSGLALFSYNTTGGVSSLDFAGTAGPLMTTMCLGAATNLSAICTLNFKVLYPIGTNAVVIFTFPEVIGSGPPTITLVSSVTTPVPEPTSLAPFVTALGLLAALGVRQKRRAASRL